MQTALASTVLVALFLPSAAAAQVAASRSPQPEATTPMFLRDRGTGVATSMFGTYVRRGEWLVYPFFEHYSDGNLEYAPEEFGVPGNPGNVDYRGRYRASEALFFISHGITENLAFEAEAAIIRASFDKSPQDGSALPARLEESGLGDVEAQLRWRWRKEDERRPELFSYGEVVFPHHKDKTLIGTPGWELKFGTGLTRGFSWGTLTARAAVEYVAASSSPFDLGEYAVEYLKRVSPSWRFYVGVEGTQDELSLVAEAQWHLSPNVFIRLNSSAGLTSKATDWAPELGVVLAFPPRPRGGTR